MANILLVWELGGGRGHLGPLRQLAERLIQQGHQVTLVSRNVIAAGEIFASLPVGIFAAPVLPAAAPYAIAPVRSFVDILHNVGFGSRGDLTSLFGAWITLFRAVRPDAIVFDHSPIALAASYAVPAKRILVGTGFASPPPGCECDDLRSWIGDRQRSPHQNVAVLANLNRVRARHGLYPLESVGEMFAAADLNLLATFPQLDHFGPRPGGKYAGVFPLPKGDKPQWPRRGRARAFAYLKPHDLVGGLMKELTRRQVATLLYTGSDDREVLAEYSTQYVSVSSRPFDLAAAMAEADFAILNGTHASTAAALLAGKPSLHFPLVLDQWMVAHRVRELGAGWIVAANRPQSLSEIMDRAIGLESAERARDFAASHSGFDANRALFEATDAIESAIAA